MTSQVIIIDWRVEDPQSIVAGLPTDSAWYVLKPGEDGIEQVRRLLANYTGLDSVQIVSHGSPGSLLLGGSVVDAADLAAHAAALASIGSALSDTGDLLLYGCDVAQGDRGLAFVEQLANLTGADVAASTDATGAAALGGNWTLEAATGPIEAPTLTGGTFSGLLPALPNVVVSISANSADKTEGNSGSKSFTFTVSLDQSAPGSLTVDWTVDGSGVHQADAFDFAGSQLPQGTVSFSFGESTKSVTVDVAGDTTVEFDEGFMVFLSNLNPSGGFTAQTGAGTAFGTIRNDDSAVSIAPTVAFKAEGLSGTSAFTFTVTRTGDLSTVQTVAWTVTGSSPHAAVATDFAGNVFPSDILTFGINETSKTITINVQGDVSAEPEEGFVVTLSNATNGLAIGTETAYGTIIDGNGIVYLASVQPNATQADYASFSPSLSAGGTKVAFASAATNLGQGGGGGEEDDIFVKDLTTGVIQNVSTDSAGNEANNSSSDPVLVGNKVVFASRADNLLGAGADYNFTQDIFVKDLSTGVVTRVSTDSAGNEADGGSSAPAFSPDGTKVAFVSSADNLVTNDTNGTEDIFVKDLSTGAVQRVSTSASGEEAQGDGEAGGYSYDPIFSPDSAKVAFVSVANNLVSGSSGNYAEVFVKTLAGGAIVRASSTVGGAEANGDSYDPAFSPNGSLVAFTSTATNLVSDSNGVSDVFVKNLLTGAVTRISTDATGAQANGASWGAVFSPDGARVAFISDASNLVAGDTPGTTDIFVKDLLSSAIARISTSVTGGQPDGSFDSLGFSSDGNRLVFYSSASNLVNGDTNDVGDIFIQSLSTVVVSATDATKAEGQSGPTLFTFTVTRSGDTSFTQTVAWTVAGSGGQPATGSDFTGGSFPSGIVTFAPTETSKTVNVSVAGDTTVEPDEGFTLTLSNPSTNLYIMGPTANGTIQNDDTSTVSIGPASISKAEGNGGTTVYVFTVTLGQPAASHQTVNWGVTGSGLHPADAADFFGSLPHGILLFEQGDSSALVTIAVSRDTVVEFDEGFTVTLSSPSSGLVLGTSTATGVIQNDDVSTVSIAAQSASHPEGNSGTTAFTFTVNLDQQGVTSQTVNWAVTGSGAHGASGSDFGGALPSGTVTFAAGETAKLITMQVSGDTAVEFNEEFTVSLSNASSGLALGTTTASGTIQNDDVSIVSIAPASLTKTEGNIATTSYTFTVSLDQQGVVDQSVDWAVTGTGTHPADSTDFGGSLPSGAVTFAAGETSKTITISVSGDATIEFDEDFRVTLSSPSSGLVLGTSTATGTIQNDDNAIVSIAAQSAVKAEGNSGTTAFTFTVSLDRAMLVDQTAGWTVNGFTAHQANAVDFGGALPSGTVTFAAGELSKTVTVFVTGDTTVEFDEGFAVGLTALSSGLTLGTSSASGTIQNDDVPTVSIAALSASKPEGNSGTTSFTFTVSLDQAAVNPNAQSVDWAVTGSGSHAANGADFGGALPSGTVTFAAGETSKTVTVLVAADQTVEFDEQFTVTLSNASSGLSLGTSTASGTIQNDDRSSVSIAAQSAAKPEGDSGTTTYTFTVSLDQAGVASQSVNWTVTGSGAHAADSADFGGALPSGSVTFAAGETSKIVTVTVSGDATVEFDEGFTVALSGLSSGLVLGTSSASGSIQNDDRSVVSITADAASQAEGDSGTTPFTFTVSLDQAGVVGQSVAWSVVGSGAHPANAADFGGTLPSGFVTFAPGETTKTVTIDVSGDTALEVNEGFAVVLAQPSSRLVLGTATAASTIINDDGLIASIADLSAVKIEGNSGTALFTFTVSLNHVLDIAGVTVDWAVSGSGDHPANAADFGGTLPAGTATFSPGGEQVQTITVLVSGDAAVEFDETFAVTLSNPSAGISIGVETASGTITNDDVSVVSIAAASAVKAEGSGGGTTAFTFTVSLDQAGVSAQSVDWSVAGTGGHAASAADFGGILPSGSATFAAGETSKTVTVLVSADSTVEFDEGFVVTLANPSAALVLGTISAAGSILNDDKPTASIAAAASRPEGDSGTTSFVFTVSLDQASLSAQTVDWSVAGSGAHGANAADFGGSLPSGTLSFAAGETSKVVSVVVTGDTTVEFDEGFTVTLANASSGLALGTASAGATIVNDDGTVVSIAPLSANRPEGNNGTTSFTFTVSLAQAGVTGQVVDWSVVGAGAHAADAADFGGQLPSGTVSFAAGETSKTVTIGVSGDTAVEFDEDFAVILSNASPGLTLGTSTANGHIQNDDTALVSIAALSAVKAEGNSGTTSFTFTVSLDKADTANQSVVWSTTGSGPQAANAADFGGALPSGVVTFAAGETSTTVTVSVAGDGTVELDEGFTVTLSNASAGLALGTASASGTIVNDDASVVSIAALSADKLEGNSGTTSFTFTVSLDQAGVASQAISWAISGSGAHPADAADFGGSLPSGTVTFAAGETSKVVTVAVSGDTGFESDEGFVATLSTPSAGLVLGTATAAGTIRNDDGVVVSVAALSASKPEGDEAGTTLFTFTVSLAQASPTSQTVAWSVTGSGPHPADGTDFGGALPAGTVTFAAGETSKVVTVAVSGDSAAEFDEGFSLALSNASVGLTLGTATASGTILNDDGASVSIAPLAATRAEGNSGPAPFTFVVTLDDPSAFSTTVNWVVSGTGAHPADAADFGGTLPAGSVTLAPGETSKTVTVMVSGDTAVESDETFEVTLSDPSGTLVLATATATGSILNDDRSKVSIVAQAATQAEGNGGTTAFTFTVSLDQAGVTSQTVDWAVKGSGAHAADATDFGGALPAGTVTFGAGETTKTVTILASGDTTAEFNEGFDVTLANASAGLMLGTVSASGTILNDDASVSIAALSANKAEGNAGTTPFTFVVTLSGETSVAHSVDYAVAVFGGDPAVSSDFSGNVLPTGSVTFAPGETSKTVAIEILGDVAKEATETFAVTLVNPSAGVAIGSASAIGTIVNDDSLPAPPPVAHDDAYVDFPGQTLHIGAASGVLFNDASTVPLTASLLNGTSHGTLALAADGGFDYTPDPGFFGIDSFTYRATGVGSTNDEHALIYVTPVLVGSTTTLDLARLTAEEQVAATYTAFFGRGPDAFGFEFWVHEFAVGAATQSPAAVFANIASSFGASDEAKGLYPFLAQPQGASDAQIGAFLDGVYNNLFNRSADAAGLAYWTDQVKATLAAGQFVGTVLTSIISGAQNTAQFQDITTLMSKVTVSLSYVHDQEQFHVPWTAADDGADATALLHAVTADPQSVLVGISQAYNLALAALSRVDGS